ncbi:insulinase family protein [Pseudoalteromonas peptidolytica]|uniref:insulinase family protein n=1 Tax=Pseudoalteromonas peptidolytica TaxID=61150 RepID=UPI00298E94D7|nr:insulinase family protein [Pseudoalteromonas peptidolytica]MDW7548515.1 insulinase family protein [Pseudoalteromonas peptidolytica]
MKKLFAISALTVAVITGCSTTSSLNSTSVKSNLLSPKLIVSPNDDRQYQTLTLENGIDVILVSDPSVSKSAAALSVGVGLLHDPMSQQGMAHYLEHMLFLGTEKYPDSKGYSEFMTNNGGAHNAYTWLDITNYMFKVNNDAYDEALDRFSDFFKSPKLYPEYTEKEKNAVNAEWSMRREMDFFGQFKLARNMMGEHPANRFLIGNLETLGDKEGSNLHQETVNFYNKYYSANIMKLAMISNEPIEQMVAKAKKHFTSIKNKHIEKPLVTQELNYNKVGQKLVHYKPNEDVKTLKLDFTIENNAAEFAVKPNYFITYLLSNEMAGSPAQVLKEQGLISSLTAYATPNSYGNYGTLQVDIQLTDQGIKQRELITGTVLDYIELIKQQGVDSRYFKEIQTSLNNQFRFLEKGDEFGYVSNLADSMQHFPVNHAINASYYYAQFDADAVNAVLEQLTPEHMRVWYISKDEPTEDKLHFYDGEYKIVDLKESDFEHWKKAANFTLSLPSVNTLLPEHFALKTVPADAKKGVQKVIDADGVTIWHAASERFYAQPKGSLKIYINNPESLDDIKTEVALAIWSDLYRLDKAKLMTEASVAGMYLGLTPSNGLMLDISGFTDKQSLLLKDALSGLQISVSERAFEQAVDRYVRGIQNQAKEFPFRQAFSVYQKLVRSGSYDDAALIAAAKSLTVGDLETVQDHVLSNNQVRVFAYGNYDKSDLEVLKSTLDNTLAKRKNITQYARAAYWKPEKKQTLVWQQDIDVADVAVIDFAVHPVPGYAQKAAAMILQGHLRTAAFERLRTQEQLAYAVGATGVAIDEYSALGFYIQTPVKDAKSMQARFDEYKLEYAEELNKLTSETFTQLKNAVLVSLTEAPKNLSEELQPLLGDWFKENMEFDSKAKLIAAVEAITLADVKDYYQKTVMNPDAARLNIQLRGSKFKSEPFADLPMQIKLDSLEQAKKQVKFQP